MKKSILLIAILATALSFGQNTFPASGNVGIGTINPLSKLSVIGSITLNSGLTNTSARPLITENTLPNGEIRALQTSNYLADDGFVRMSAGGGTNGFVKSYIDLSGYSTIPDMDRNIVFGTYGTERMRINSNGNIGIGTTNPSSKLTIGSSSPLFLNSGASSSTPFLAVLNSPNPSLAPYGWAFYDNQTNGNLDIYRRNGTVQGEQTMSFNRNTGDIGIGTKSPAYKLDVCGTIRAKEVKVDLLGGCDFVFKKDYKLMSLNELEKFVTTKQHLPEIASEKEMIENGLNMKEFQMQLLQKIEELTLYTIEQNKQLKLQSNKIEKQNQEFKILRTKIKKLESKKDKDCQATTH